MSYPSYFQSYTDNYRNKKKIKAACSCILHSYVITCLWTCLDDVFICAALMRFVVLCVLQQYIVHICAGILEQLIGAVEYDESDLAVTKDAQFIGLLHQPKLSLGKCDLEIYKIFSQLFSLILT